MYSNIGRKIRKLAVFNAIIGILASVALGIFLVAEGMDSYYGIGDSLTVTGIAVTVFGSLLSWVVTFLLYGFGRLVENSDIVAAQYRTDDAMERPAKKKSKEKGAGFAKNAYDKGSELVFTAAQKIVDKKNRDNMADMDTAPIRFTAPKASATPENDNTFYSADLDSILREFAL